MMKYVLIKYFIIRNSTFGVQYLKQEAPIYRGLSHRYMMDLKRKVICGCTVVESITVG